MKVAALPVAKMATVARARIVAETRGMMKVVVNADTDEILGAALLSYDSHEVINTVALAMRHGITATQLRDEIYTHPSMTEAFNQLLGALTLTSLEQVRPRERTSDLLPCDSLHPRRSLERRSSVPSCYHADTVGFINCLPFGRRRREGAVRLISV